MIPPALRGLAGIAVGSVRCLAQRVALYYCRGQRRVLGPALLAVFDAKAPPALGRLVQRFDDHINRLWEGNQLAA